MDQFSRQLLEPIKVLVLDDNRHMINLVTQILYALGCKNVVPALDGADAFQQMKREHLDVAIVDYNMSPINGVEFTKLVRTAKDSPNPYIPIVMLTGRTDTESVRLARDAGATEFLAKPVSVLSICQRLIEVIERPRPFIRTKRFFGPDRRRHVNPKYRGPFRRKDDAPNGKKNQDPGDPDQSAVDALFADTPQAERQ
jgi:CheY-like chemotaxis protein